MIPCQVTRICVTLNVVDELSVEPLAVVVGSNCRRLRTAAGLTQNELAKHGRDAGLRWTASKVGDFEAGRTNPTFATIIAAASALSAATRSDVHLADLVRSDAYVLVTDELDPTGDALAAILRGERTWASLVRREVGHLARTPVDLSDLSASTDEQRREFEQYPQLGDVATADLLELVRRRGLDEQRVAKRLGISDYVLAAASLSLWRQSFSDERDDRAGPDANAQRRGRVARELQAELREALTRGNHQ